MKSNLLQTDLHPPQQIDLLPESDFSTGLRLDAPKFQDGPEFFGAYGQGEKIRPLSLIVRAA